MRYTTGKSMRARPGPLRRIPSNFPINGAAWALLITLSLTYAPPSTDAATIALLLNVLMAIMAILAIAITVPRNDPSARA